MKPFFILSLLLNALAVPLNAAHWPLDALDETVVVRGHSAPAPGASGQSLVLEGRAGARAG